MGKDLKGKELGKGLSQRKFNKLEFMEEKTLNMKLVYYPPTAEDYVNLRLRSGMGNKNL